MQLKEFLLTQFDREALATRTAIERVPKGRNDWRPHPRSMDFGYLAALVATMPGWASFMIERDEINLGNPSSEGFRPGAVERKSELRTNCQEAIARGRAALDRATEECLMKPWRFMVQGQVMSEEPRYVALANGLLSHLAHHRGQLTVYLRLLGASVPAIYGPSADEQS
jgi:uncharacterized damage-inducible protein DinB